MACAACGDLAKVRRAKLPCCKDCLKVSDFKFESAVEELERIKNSKDKKSSTKKSIGKWNAND